MWLFTVHGMVSVVCARKGPKSRIIDPTKFMVRARTRRHLESLKHRFHNLLSGIKIVADEGTDYPYRMFVSRDTYMVMISELTNDIDYDNFKGAVERVSRDADYEQVLHKVWAIGKEMEVQ